MSENRTPGFLEATGTQAVTNKVSANQIYKKLGGKDGTGMRFTEWLEEQKRDGKLAELLKNYQAAESNFQDASKDPDAKREGETETVPATTEKRFLWMPMKYGIPVAIIGAAAIGYGIYRLVKHYKKAA